MLNGRRTFTVSLGMLLFSSLAVGALGFKADPYMKSTRTQLMKARACLIAAEADKAGRRDRAIAYTHAAIDEATAAMKSSHHASPSGETVASPATAEVGSNMRKALVHLKQAKENLGAAAESGGRRAKIMEQIDKAIEEVEKIHAESN